MAFLNVGLLNLQVYCGFLKNILTCDANKDVQQNTSEKAELSEKRESKRVHKGLN